MLSLVDWLQIVVALIFAALRVGGVKHKSFQAFAHLYVGGLFGAWLASRVHFFLWLALALSIVELLCFLYGAFKSFFHGLL